MQLKKGQFDPQPKPSFGRPKEFSGVLGRVLKSLGLTGKYNGWLVVTRWDEIVGPAVSSKAKAVSYEDGCIFVAVRDSTWRQELSMRQEELLEKIHSLPYGKAVKRIRLVKDVKGFE
ncbi:MAG: DUF721 domain-containing protein [Candidatus Zixiibacteriota bacterium]|nr:MAG: DUF721 domain-containing protein [candidate division Zixibacteria bacterium]